MGKIKFLNIDALHAERERIIKERNDCLMNCNYKKAEKLLKELQPLNDEFNEMLKNSPPF